MFKTDKIKQPLDNMIVISYNYIMQAVYFLQNDRPNNRKIIGDRAKVKNIIQTDRRCLRFDTFFRWGEEMSEKLNPVEELALVRQELKKLKVALRAEELRTRISSEYTNFGLWEYDISTDICYQYKKLSGRYENNLEPIVHFRDSVISWGLVKTDDLPVFNHFCDAMSAGEREVGCEIRIVNDDCEMVWIRYEGRTVYDDDGNPIKVVGRTLDITQEKGGTGDETNKGRDALTDMYTSALFRDFVTEKRNGRNRYNNAALLCVGVDKFPEIIARHGAEYGDYIQKTVGKILAEICNTLRESLAARVRDGEFLLYLEFTEESTIDDTARRIVDMVRDYIYDGEPVTASVGISLFKSGSKPDDVYAEAYAALTEAGKSGGVCFMRYTVAMSMNLYNRPVDFNTDSDMLAMSGNAAKVYNLLIRAFCTPKERNAMVKEAFKAAGQCVGASSIVIFTKENESFRRSIIYSSLDTDDGEVPCLEMSCSEEGLAAAFGKENSVRVSESENKYKGLHLINGAVCAECRAIRIKGHISAFFAVVFDSRFELSRQDVQIINVLENSLSNMHNSYIEDIDEGIRQRLRSTAISAHRLEGFSIIPGEFVVEEVGDNAAEHYGLCCGDVCYAKIRGLEKPCENCPAVQLDANGSMFASTAYYNEGERRWLDIAATADRNINGDKRYIISYTDITDCLGKIQMTDQLTGLMTFNVFTAEALRLTAAPDGDVGYFVIVMNIADFARINDEKGYETGNSILVMMADILQKCTGADELVCRAGNSRFAALFKSISSSELEPRMNLLMNSIQKQIYEKLQVHIYLLSGICYMGDEHIGVMSAIDRAITAQKTVFDRVYYSENLMVFYDGVMREKIKERRFIEEHMKEALENNEFCTFYQPKVNIETGKVVGAEALVRWIRPDGEMISPGKFVPIFEENGFITQMDFAIYRHAVADIARWLRKGLEVPLISLNVSRRHLADEDFCEKFNALVDGIGVPHEYIELEITESLLTENLDKLVKMATGFKERGYRISIDDFGSGYSSLNLITMLPFDTLKIDGGFFLRNDLTDKNRKVITSVVSLAKSLNLETVSEGVETQVQVDFLKDLGCDMIQGFFYYKPMPGMDFEQLISAQPTK